MLHGAGGDDDLAARPIIAKSAGESDRDRASRLEHVLDELRGQRRGDLADPGDDDNHSVAFPDADLGSDGLRPRKVVGQPPSFQLERGENGDRPPVRHA